MVTLNPAWQLGIERARGLDRGGQGRRPRDLQRPPLLAGRARGDDPGGRHRVLRPGARPGRPERGRQPRREVAGESTLAARPGAGRAPRASLAASLAAAAERRRPVVAITGRPHRHRLRARDREGHDRDRRTARSRRWAPTCAVPPGATVIDGAGQDRLPGPHRRPHHPGPHRDPQRARLGGHDGDRRREPARAGLGRRATRTAS